MQRAFRAIIEDLSRCLFRFSLGLDYLWVPLLDIYGLCDNWALLRPIGSSDSCGVDIYVSLNRLCRVMLGGRVDAEFRLIPTHKG